MPVLVPESFQADFDSPPAAVCYQFSYFHFYDMQNYNCEFLLHFQSLHYFIPSSSGSALTGLFGPGPHDGAFARGEDVGRIGTDAVVWLFRWPVEGWVLSSLASWRMKGITAGWWAYLLRRTVIISCLVLWWFSFSDHLEIRGTIMYYWPFLLGQKALFWGLCALAAKRNSWLADYWAAMQVGIRAVKVLCLVPDRRGGTWSLIQWSSEGHQPDCITTGWHYAALSMIRHWCVPPSSRVHLYGRGHVIHKWQYSYKSLLPTE